MARTPSMTAEECEALLGPRGYIAVASDNRGNVQKWLVAKGVPAGIAKSLTISQLSQAYNGHDTTYVQGLINQAREVIETRWHDDKRNDTNDTMQDTDEMPAPQPAPYRHEEPKTEDTKASAADHLYKALALLSEGGATNEARVIELIYEHAPKPEGIVVKHEIVIKDKGEERKLDDEPRHEIFPTALSIVAAGCNLFLVGPAGSGKTTLAEQISRAINVPFHFNGALDSPYKLSGFIDAQGRIVSTAFRRAYSEGGVYLFDEIDASLPGALLAFNAALANGHADFPDGTISRHKDFYCIAAANTFGLGADRQYVGRNQLDAASLDRFAFLEMPYDEKLERLLAGDNTWTEFVQKARRAVATLKLRHVISPRASIMGAKMLAAGMDRATVEKTTIWKSMDAGDVAKVRAALGV